MQRIEIGVQEHWSLAPLVGFEHPLLYLDAHTIVHTWIILGIMFLVLLVVRWAFTKKESVTAAFVTDAVANFKDTVNQTLPRFNFNHFNFIAALFVFIFLCNTASVIPGLEEPTSNVNTTLALGIISFLYTQVVTIRTHGWLSYIKEYFAPLFIMLPLNIVGRLASIVSISFRLFGNIFGGSIINTIYFNGIQRSILLQTLGIISGLNLIITLFFGIFEGFLQAFVFSMLSLTYLGIAIQGEGEH